MDGADLSDGAEASEEVHEVADILLQLQVFSSDVVRAPGCLVAGTFALLRFFWGPYTSLM